MNAKIYEYDAEIKSSEIGKGGVYVTFPYDIREEFGKGRVFVHATFDGEPFFQFTNKRTLPHVIAGERRRRRDKQRIASPNPCGVCR